MDFIREAEPLLKTFWFIALPASIIFILQIVMTFIGIDSHDGTDADFSGHLNDNHAPFQLFSLRNLVNFLLGFSWTGIGFYSTISNHFLLLSLAFTVGFGMLGLFFVIMKQVNKLAEDNSFKITSTIDKTAEVYLTIPENKKGKGKILISVNGSVRELEAITENNTKIETGSVVSVVSVEGNSLVVVKPI